MPSLVPWGVRQYLDGNGKPLVAGSVGFYVVGTSGSQLGPIWADENETVPLQNPIPLDAAGMPFSGGSQVAIWGDGQLQEVVRDSDGVIVTTAIVEFPFSSSGGTIFGDLEVQGNLQLDQTLDVSGDANIDGTMTAGSINNAGNLEIGGILTTGSDIDVGGNANINGSASIVGDVDIQGATTTDGITDSAGITTTNLGASGTISADEISANEIILAGATLSIPPIMQFGIVAFDANGNGSITFDPAFDNLGALVLNSIPGGPIQIVSYSNAGANVSLGGTPEALPYNAFWFAVGN